MKIIYRSLSIFSSVLLSSIFLIHCGGEGVDSAERVNTYAATRAKAEDAYNSNDFDKTIEIYEKILAQNPNDQEARTRLAFAYNAKAKLSLFDLVGGFAKLGSSSDNSSKRLVETMSIVGLSAEERAKVSSSLALVITPKSSLSEIRTQIPKAKLLHQSWSSLCLFVPKDLLKSIAGSDPAIAKVYGIGDAQKCGDGSSETVTSSAIALSGLFALLGETAILFQVALDQDGDGQIDIINTMNKTITELQSVGNVTTAPSTEEAVSASITKIASALNNLTDFADTMTGEVFTVLFANVSAMGSLVVLAPGLPKDAVAKIRSSIARFRDQQDNIRGFLKGAVSSTKGLTTQRVMLATAGKQTSRGFEVMAKGLKAIGRTDDQIKQIIAPGCTSLDAFIVKYGLEKQVSKGRSC